MGLFRARNARRDGAESEPGLVELEAEEALTSALHESDTAAEIISDSAEDATRPQTRRLLLGAIGLVLTLSSLVAARRRRRKR